MGLGLFVKKDSTRSDYNDVNFLINYAAESSSSGESSQASPGCKRRLKIFEDITTDNIGFFDE